jgi:hypothetical protein
MWGRLLAGLSALLLCAASASADVISFDQTLTEDQVIVTAWARIYEGHGISGTPVLEMNTSPPGHGSIYGTVNSSSNEIDSITIRHLYVRSDDTDIRLSGSIGSTSVEIRVTNAYFDSYHVWTLPVDVSTGDFHGDDLSAAFVYPTLASITLGGLITYEVPPLTFPPYYPPYQPGSPYQFLIGHLDGNVEMHGTTPTVNSVVWSGSWWEYIGNYIPGVDYSLQWGLNIDPAVPEPATLSVLALGGLPLLMRGRR